MTISAGLSDLASTYLDYFGLLRQSIEGWTPAILPDPPVPEDELLVAGIRAGVETIHHGDKLIEHITQSDAQMVERGVRAAWGVWKEGPVE